MTYQLSQVVREESENLKAIQMGLKDEPLHAEVLLKKRRKTRNN